jgi:hypothetical protein
MHNILVLQRRKWIKRRVRPDLGIIYAGLEFNVRCMTLDPKFFLNFGLFSQ